MSKEISSKSRRVTSVVIGAITMIVLVAFLAVLSVLPGPRHWVDTVAATDNALDQTVSPTQLESYCPAPMGLADTGQYGDSAFQATTGNLSTQARYASFDSVYSATVSAFGKDSTADSLTLKDGDLTDDDAVKAGSQSIDSGSRFIDTRMLQAVDGTGTVGAIASWADDGDLKGVSASSCETTSLTHSFLLSGTATGTTQQLIIANPSTKPTTVTIAVWGSKKAGELTMSTQSSLAVPASGESSLDLSAAAADQDGLYVTVSSKETPIAAVVRTVSMDGLTSKGSDFALPLYDASNASVVTPITKGDAVKAYLFAASDTGATLSWITEHGLVQAKDVSVKANKVEVADLGEAPDDALGVMSTAEDDVSFSVKATRSGDADQADFTLINASATASFSGLAIPDDVDASVSLANSSNQTADVTLHAYDAQGKSVATKQVELAANAAKTISAKDLSDGDNAAVLLMLEDESQQVGWGVRLTHGNLGDGKVAGLSSLGATPLKTVTTHVWARDDASIVH